MNVDSAWKLSNLSKILGGWDLGGRGGSVCVRFCAFGVHLISVFIDGGSQGTLVRKVDLEAGGSVGGC